MSMKLEKLQIGDTNTVALNKIFNILKAIDKHDHSVNQGVVIKFSDIVVVGDIDFKNNAMFNVASLKFEDIPEGDDSIIPEDKDLVYFYAGNMYIKHNDSPAIQLTANGEFNSSLVGGISGDYSGTASDIIYDSVSNTFFFTEDSINPSNVKAGKVRLYNDDNKYTEIALPEELTVGYTLVLPPNPPVDKSFLVLNDNGELGYLPLTSDAGTAYVVKNNEDGTLERQPITLSLIQGITGSPYLLIQIGEDGKLSPVSSSAYRLPSGRTVERPTSPVEGMLRFNTTDSLIEYYNGQEWRAIMTTAGTDGLSVDDLSDVSLDDIEPLMYLRYFKDDVDPEMSRWRPSFLSKYDWALEPTEGEGNDGVIWGKPTDVTDLGTYSLTDFNNVTTINPEFDIDPKKVLADLGDYRLCLVDYPNTPAVYKIQVFDASQPFNFRDYNPTLDTGVSVRWDLFKTEGGDVFESVINVPTVNLFDKYNEWGDVITVYMKLYVNGVNSTPLQRHPRLSLPVYVRYPVPILEGSCIVIAGGEVIVTPNVAAGCEWGNITGTFDPESVGITRQISDKLEKTEGVSYDVVTPSTSVFDFLDVVNLDMTAVNKDELPNESYLVNIPVLGTRKFICSLIDPFPLQEIGDLYTHDGEGSARLPSLNRPAFLMADSTTETGLKWAYNTNVGVEYPMDDDGNPLMDAYPTSYYIFNESISTGGGAIMATGVDVISDLTVYNKGLTAGVLEVYHGDPDAGGELLSTIDPDSEIGVMYSDLREYPNLLYIKTIDGVYQQAVKTGVNMVALTTDTARNTQGVKEVNPYYFKMLSIGSSLDEIVYDYTVAGRKWRHLLFCGSFNYRENTVIHPDETTETGYSNVRPIGFCSNNYSLQNDKPFTLAQIASSQFPDTPLGQGLFKSGRFRATIHYETAVFKSPVPLGQWRVGKTSYRDAQGRTIGYEGYLRWKTSWVPWVGTKRRRTWNFTISQSGQSNEVIGELMSNSTYTGSLSMNGIPIPTYNGAGVYLNSLDETRCRYLHCPTPAPKGLFHPAFTAAFNYSHHYAIDSTDFMFHIGGGQGDTEIILGSCHDGLADFHVTQVRMTATQSGGVSNPIATDVKGTLNSIFELTSGEKIRGFNYQENGTLLLATWLASDGQVGIGMVTLDYYYDMSTAVPATMYKEVFGVLAPVKGDYDERQKTLVPFLENTILPDPISPNRNPLHLFSIVSKKNKVRAEHDNSDLVGSSAPVKYMQTSTTTSKKSEYSGEGVVIALRNKPLTPPLDDTEGETP